MSELNLSLETRKITGKEFAKKLRKDGKIPGIYYHHGEEPILFSVERKAVQTLLGQESSLLDIAFDKKDSKKSVIREIQFDPITNQPIHIDLMGIKMTEKLSVTVPVHLLGIAAGVKNEGGILQHLIRDIEIECLPSDIPDNIEIDISELNIGQGVQVSNIEIERVKILEDADKVVANVIAPRIIEEEVVAEEEEEGVEPEVVGEEAEQESNE
jgi:large subunit ribosomal protein L25